MKASRLLATQDAIDRIRTGVSQDDSADTDQQGNANSR